MSASFALTKEKEQESVRIRRIYDEDLPFTA